MELKQVQIQKDKLIGELAEKFLEGIEKGQIVRLRTLRHKLACMYSLNKEQSRAFLRIVQSEYPEFRLKKRGYIVEDDLFN